MLTSYEDASLVLVRLEVGAVEGVLGEPAVGHAQLRVGPVLGPVQPGRKLLVMGGGEEPSRIKILMFALTSILKSPGE